MQLLSLVSLLGAAALGACQTSGANGTAVTGKLGDARQVRNNPVIGEVWVATFNSSTVKGTVTAIANTVGVNYTIDVTGLPAEKGPYKYHVHLKAVPADGNCADTGGHLDSYVRGDSPPCDASAPQTCEVGDLSGKYGTVAGPTVLKSFNDPYTALNIIMLGYIGDRGIVFHDASSARIACATLVKSPNQPKPQ
ncbi:Cu,Zn superoxide dismutase-like protein [Lasiosphaeria miniovina]|uniref:superoxide dismutase n=1 Tax=Lasiosphaeria miniovina TaxID=1954250 RepID=A0AA40EDW4_9PEZI|nr:Cu,Zn superoxide dismutase-like protein [Lasiosphaeria miniovina]KAK0734782.1 Cu,Zn superoxide dismutase-like protein [Lasiosphaeria miniovina]